MADPARKLVTGISALIPAGGYSSRMHDFKPLLPLGETTLIQRTISLFQAIGIKEVIVVTGHNREKLSAVIALAGAREVFNAGYADGMFSSVRCGVAALPPTCRGFFLLPADIAAIRPTTLEMILRAFDRNPHAVVVPGFMGESGHPPLIPASVIPDILAADAGGNLREILFPGGLPGASRPEKAGARPVVPLAVPDRGILMDADRPKDYENLGNRVRRLDIPDREECLAIMTGEGIAGELRAHMELVASTALTLWWAVKSTCPELAPDLVRAGGLLHDICKSEPEHDQAGMARLSAMGFPRVAEIAGSHMDLTLPADGLTEAAVVFLADKLCRGDRMDLDYEARFLAKAKKYPHAGERILHRLETARHIHARIESAAGRSLRDILQ